MSKRLYFGNIKEVIEPPNLIEIQLQSYFDFLQQDTPAAARKNIGLQGVLKEIFPIKSYDENIELDFVSYDIEQPKMSDYEAIRAGETYSAALQVTFKLKSDNESKEETVYMGELPMMTNRGTFVINGAERVIVSQLHRSPGICFESAQHLIGAPGWRSSLTPTTCFTFTLTAAAAAANSLRRRLCATWASKRTVTSSASSTTSARFP